MTSPSRPIVRYHGGKFRLRKWIVSHFPAHRVYTEAFGGGGSVLMHKAPAYAEIYNDLDREMVNLFRMARDRGDELIRAVELTPYAREEFDLSFVATDDPLEQARRTSFRSFAGFGGNLTRANRNATPQRTGFRRYSSTDRRATPAGDWRNWPEGLAEIVDRLRGVIIEHRDASAVLMEHDGPETLHYLDPPYVHSTRGFSCGGTKGGASHRGYRFEMTDDQHRALSVVARSLVGMVLVSGYACELYDVELYPDWDRRERASVADGARARTEVLWLNPACSAALRADEQQGTLGVGT